jgi:hypothetical protein
VACKLVFLEDNERRSQTDIDSVSGEMSNLFYKLDQPPPYEPFKLPIQVNSNSLWDPIAVARQAEVESLFDQFMKKMEFTIPSDPYALAGKNSDFDPLFCMLGLQRSLLFGFTKRMKEHAARTADTVTHNGEVHSKDNPTPQSGHGVNDGQPVGSHMDVTGGAHIPRFPDWGSMPSTTEEAQSKLDHLRARPIPPLWNTFYINSINFDTIAPEEVPQPAHLWEDDILWDTVMNDFTLPI